MPRALAAASGWRVRSPIMWLELGSSGEHVKSQPIGARHIGDGVFA
jgi:hypothetical protein